MRGPSLSDADRMVLDAARADLGSYLAVVHRTDAPEIAGGLAAPAPHHERIINALMDDSLGHTLVVAPRGSGKTMLVQAWMEWRLGRARADLGEGWANDFRVVYVSNTAHQAYKVSNAIKATIEGNAAYHALFPHVKPHRDKWSEPEWKVLGSTVKDANFIAVGVGGPLLGARCLYLVVDDVADQENMRSAVERLKLVGAIEADSRGWLDTTAMPCLVPWGRCVNTCTRWHDQDAAAWSISRGWHTIYLKALEECDDPDRHSRLAAGGDSDRMETAGRDFVGCPGHSYWPERFPAERLLAMQRETPLTFALQYQNEVVPYGGMWFRREWFDRRFDEVPVNDHTIIGQSWDTASTLSGRSYTVGLTFACVPTQSGSFDYYVLDMYRQKVEFGELKEAIIGAAWYHHPDAVLIEAKSSGIQAIQELGGEQGLRVIPVKPHGERGGIEYKEWVQSVTLPCRTGRVLLPSEDRLRRRSVSSWLPAFLSEMLAYDGEGGGRDDIVTAFCQFVYTMDRYASQLAAQRRIPPPLVYGRSRERLRVL